MKKLLIPPALRVPILHFAKTNWPVVVVALLSWISVLVCLDPVGSYPGMPEGPGLTVDEIFNVEQGVYLVELSRSLGWLNLIPGTSQEAFRPENGFYNPDHPPLGRWWLGIHHHLTWWLFPPFEPDRQSPIVTACARTGSATAFALTVLLIGTFATGWSGQAVGVLTAVSLVMMPRAFGHAHLASLETMTNLTCTAAVLTVAHCWSGPERPTGRAAVFAGVLLGLGLLTKIQAVLIPIPVVAWALWRWRAAAMKPVLIWGVTAFAVFFSGWPYLWDAPVGHLLEYLGRTTHRSTIYVWYFGQKYPDKLVPWHYPFVIFGLTVPVVLHGLGLWGLFQKRDGRVPPQPVGTVEKSARPSNSFHLPADVNSPARSARVGIESERTRDILLLMCTLFPLIVFALPSVAVYDGERLFLTSYPLWAIFVGRGWLLLWNFLTRWTRSVRLATVVCLGLLLWTVSPLFSVSPCHLCYYNEAMTLLFGGVDKAGLEVDYWGEGITRRLLRRLVQVAPEGAMVAVTPTLHQFQAEEYRRQSPILRGHGVKTVEFRDDSSQEFILVYRRLADLPTKLDAASEMSGWTIIEGSDEAYLAKRISK